MEIPLDQLPKAVADAAKKFGANGQKGERRWDVHALGEETHGGGKSKATKPAEGLLRAVREENYAKSEPKNGDDRIVGGVEELAEHGHTLLLFGWQMGLEKTEMLHRFRSVVDTKRRTEGSAFV